MTYSPIAELRNRSPYSGTGSLTREQFLFFEMRTTAKLMTEGLSDEEIHQRIYEDKLIDLIRIYFQDTAAKGITARNQLIEIATASLSDLMKEHPEHRAEAKQDLQLLNAQKMLNNPNGTSKNTIEQAVIY